MNDTHRMRSRLTVIILMTTVFVAVLLASRGFYQADDPDRAAAAPTRAATVLAPPRGLPNFELIDASARPITRQDLAGQWTLIFMGFTNCGNVCPVTLFTLAEAVQQLPVPPRVLFVSVDPERDTPEIIDTYVRGFGGAVMGATGSAEQLREFADSLGAPFFVGEADGRYIVNHSNAVFLLDPATQYRALFSAPHEADVIAADLAQIMRTQSATALPRGRHRL